MVLASQYGSKEEYGLLGVACWPAVWCLRLGRALPELSLDPVRTRDSSCRKYNFLLKVLRHNHSMLEFEHTFES